MVQMTRSTWAIVALGMAALAQSANAQGVKDAMKDLPAWKIPEICAKDSAQAHCLTLESRAWRAVSGSWVSLPDSVKALCMGNARSSMDQSWRVLNDCVDEEMEKAGDRRAVNTRNTPGEAVPPPKAVVVAIAPPSSPPPAPVAVVPPPPAPTPVPVAAVPPPPPAPPVAVSVPAPVLGMPTAPPPFAIDAEESRRRLDAEAKLKSDAEAKRLMDAQLASQAAAAAEAKRKSDEEAARAAATAEAKRVADAESARKAAIETEAKRVAKVCEDDLVAIAKDGVIRFSFGSASLDRASNATLDKLAAATTKCPGHKIRIEAHTDSVGEPDFNQNLSQRRAETVSAYLIKAGVPAELINAEGFGEGLPIADNATQEGRAQNRRIDFKVLPKS